jgi:hypothetical protein
MRNFSILAGLSVVVLFGGIQLRRTWQAMQNRAELAQSWSTDEVQSVATRTFNNTLLVTPAETDPITCDVFIGDIISDRTLVQELTVRGFTAVQCDNKKASLR